MPVLFFVVARWFPLHLFLRRANFVVTFPPSIRRPRLPSTTQPFVSDRAEPLGLAVFFSRETSLAPAYGEFVSHGMKGFSFSSFYPHVGAHLFNNCIQSGHLQPLTLIGIRRSVSDTLVHQSSLKQPPPSRRLGKHVTRLPERKALFPILLRAFSRCVDLPLDSDGGFPSMSPLTRPRFVPLSVSPSTPSPKHSLSPV